MCDTDLVGFDVGPAHESPVQRALKYAGIH